MLSRRLTRFSIPAPIFAGRYALARGLGAFWLAAGSLLFSAEGPLLRVAFDTRTVFLSGRVDSERTAESIVEALNHARPDLAGDRSGLVIDPSASLPELAELPSLLAELGLSTHDGRLELWPDRLIIGGLTDSLVTQSALRIRAEPLLQGRALHSRLCIVNTEDLPRLEVSLTGATSGRPEPARAVVAIAAPVGSFEMPGLSFAKLLAVTRLPGQIDRLSGKSSAAAATLRAEPLATGELSQTAPARADAPMPLTATPVETLEPLASVLFSRNSFLLQANQEATIEGITRHLLSPARLGAPVRIEAVQPLGGSTAFNEYLCERRAAEVARFLTEAGVAASLLRVKTITSSSPIDGGEVRLSVEILPAPERASSSTAATKDPANPPASAPPATGPATRAAPPTSPPSPSSPSKG